MRYQGQKYLAEMPSYTYAIKAQRLLRSRGIASEIRRRESGCGFDLSFTSSAAPGIMKAYSIPFGLRSFPEESEVLYDNKF